MHGQPAIARHRRPSSPLVVTRHRRVHDNASSHVITGRICVRASSQLVQPHPLRVHSALTRSPGVARTSPEAMHASSAGPRSGSERSGRIRIPAVMRHDHMTFERGPYGARGCASRLVRPHADGQLCTAAAHVRMRQEFGAWIDQSCNMLGTVCTVHRCTCTYLEIVDYISHKR